ncbi:hypothetical protein Syun_028179 [Stephania yunnanensis]|uniref:PNPLA domain-containing protein n=1 Tax=Stephania yunnanensis TaxID=152371 RepID=A0AAP0HLP0_9MAGN
MASTITSSSQSSPLPINDSTTIELDKLTHEIFSILENKFLFGAYADPNQFLNTNKEDFKKTSSLPGKVRILSIDGNGFTDGILAAKSLAHLEEYLKSKTANPDARISDFFDIVAGSGVGGLLAALLFTRGTSDHDRPIFTADQALQFLIINRRKMLTRSAGIFRRRKTPAKFLRGVFGEPTTLKDTLKPVLISCYDLSSRSPFLFSRADAFESDGYDFAMADACGAAIGGGDGTVEVVRSVDKRTTISALGGAGIAMGNPTAAAITHVLNNKHEFPFCNGVEDLLVVSLGNGESACSVQRSPSSACLAKIVGDGASDMVDQAVSMAFGDMMETNYVRIQANGLLLGEKKFEKSSLKGEEGKKLVGIAEEVLRQKNVESVMFKGKRVAQKTNVEKLELVGEEVIREQERRRRSIFPVVVFKQNSPRTSSATTSTVSSY